MAWLRGVGPWRRFRGAGSAALRASSLSGATGATGATEADGVSGASGATGNAAPVPLRAMASRRIRPVRRVRRVRRVRPVPARLRRFCRVARFLGGIPVQWRENKGVFMKAAKVTIEPATKEDASLLAKVVGMAVGEEKVRKSSGAFFSAILEELAQREDSPYSYRHALVARVDGKSATTTGETSCSTFKPKDARF